MADLVKRLRDLRGHSPTSMDGYEHNAVGFRDKMCAEAADRIEQLERELGDVSQRLFEEGEMHVASQRELAAEKALADMLYNGTDNIADRAAYRKARGL